jgi:hypothetical protein
MPVYIMAIPHAIGENWMIIRPRKATDRRNTPIFELEDVHGKCTFHIRVLLKVRSM